MSFVNPKRVFKDLLLNVSRVDHCRFFALFCFGQHLELLAYVNEEFTQHFNAIQ